LTAGGLKYNPPPANKTLENFSKITVAGVKSSMRKVSHHNLENPFNSAISKSLAIIRVYHIPTFSTPPRFFPP